MGRIAGIWCACLTPRRVAAAIGICCLSVGNARAQPAPWADESLKVRDGLQLWLDAGRINPARVAGGQDRIESGKTLDAWPDASGRGRNLTQADEDSQPTLMKVGDAWFVRFDGENDQFRCLSQPAELTAVTVFLVAAPHSNFGGFRGLFAANAPRQRDYESGMTIDLGPGPTLKFDQLNVEGRGFGGARNLLNASSRFGTLHTIEAIVDPKTRDVRLVLDGKPQGTRPFEPAALSFEQLTVGARYYNNGPGEQQVTGPAAADTAEILVYNRTLTGAESDLVRDYLKRKYAKLAEDLPSHGPFADQKGIELVKAVNPPAVQMLVPGFSVRELPVELTNVNNVRYREDGKLVTLGYNGDIHLLSDTDGDGLEDRAELFWKNEGSIRGPLGIALTPPDYPRGRGLFVPSKGKVSLIVDTNGDDRADQEIVVASGWNEIVQNVDALGIAMDPSGNLYFGLGTANYANAYLIDADGKAAYDVHSDRGTVQKVSADFSKRETVCTGIRFPVAFAFNRDGDLFCSEQEGATWLANGNPFDELLHIQAGRHYGFPPRHPRHNPDVIDEPSTFDYGPQHESTCGMFFNEAVNGGPAFGPDWWASDAIVCGESRGKLWRTKLVKSPAGYVAASQLIARLQMLTVDACPAPNGDLVVACHSGPPDWGTGPTGIGKLFRISATEPNAPRPVAVWAESDREVRIAFDRPLDLSALRNLSERIRIEYGQYVSAGDRFENLTPPYAVVQRQLITPRFELSVSGASVTNDLRTLIINTAPMTANVHYAVALPNFAETAAVSGTLPQHPQIDLEFSLNGVHAEWQPKTEGSVPAWSGWIPHPDLNVSRGLLAGSHDHRPLWKALQQPGTLTLRTQVDLHDILRPAVQPGSTLDYEWPPERAVFMVSAMQDIKMISRPDIPVETNRQEPTIRVALAAPLDVDKPVPVTFSIPTGGDRAIDFTCSVSTNEDRRERPLPLRRFILPWVDTERPADAAEEPLKIAELEGGSWGRGRRVFRSEAAGCFKCHSLDSNDARIGPDLRNLVHRDYASVMRDIVNPSYAINPDYIGHTVAMKDGRVLTGVLRTEGGELLLGDEKGKTTRLQREEIDEMQPAKISVMPTGLSDKLTKDQLRDLMTYLLTPPPHMPLESPLPAPPVRTQAEVAAALAGSVELTEPPRPLNLVLVAGPKDHGPGEHDYPAWQRVWTELLTADSSLTVSTAWEFPDDQQLASADVVLFFQKGSFDENRAAKLDAYLKRGGGAVYLHWALAGDNRAEEFARRIGLTAGSGGIKFRHGPLTLDFYNTDHPIVRNFDHLKLYDESYWLLAGNANDVTLLATSTEDDRPQPQMWVVDHNPGRVFVSIPGHYSWTFDDPLFRILVLRGIAWTAREPVDRFNELVPLGARLAR